MFKRLAYTTFVLLCSVFIFIIVASFSLFNFNSNNDPEYSNEDLVLFCGTAPDVFSEEGEKGRTSFRAYCSACHRINGIVDGLNIRRSYLENIEPSEGYFYNYVVKQDSLLKANDPYAKAMKEQYETGFTHSFPLSKEEYENIVIYLKKL